MVMGNVLLKKKGKSALTVRYRDTNFILLYSLNQCWKGSILFFHVVIEGKGKERTLYYLFSFKYYKLVDIMYDS